MKRYKTVEAYFDDLDQWQEELRKLREILCSTGLEETVKWGMPSYTHNGKIIAGVANFKNHFAVWFFQGALLKDDKHVLINAQEGRTKALRQWRMTNKSDIKARTIKAYIKEAMELAAAGKEIKADRAKPVVVPPELKNALAKNKKANANFANFGIGKKREYAEYISEAKRADTKQKRLEKILPMIMDGIGLNDKY